MSASLSEGNTPLTQKPQFLTRENGERIAYQYSPGKGPGVVFLTGFMSDMTGSKATVLEDYCRERGQAFLRFDYSGHGASDGLFKDGTISRWAADAIFAFDELTSGKQVLIGSSMGGWIMLLLALARKDRIAGLIGIAPAPDFTEDLMKQDLSAAQLAVIERDGFLEIPTDYGDEPYTITKALLSDGADNLLLRSPIELDVPVRLIHGMQDPDVPWQTSLKIQEMLTSQDVEIHFVKNGDHRLSEEQDLLRLKRTLAALLDQLA